ncbi:MAG: putative zinc-binding metallopeptidase [Polyangiaceae bacterium]|nr:putative zinc-binding metallopeptidase [Polyangiaceae bacterium]
MKRFVCECSAPIFFDNTQCLSCGRTLGYVPETFELKPLDFDGSVRVRGTRFVKCRNYSQQGVCNWLVSESASDDLCSACELNRVIPDLAQAENRALWLEVEQAKRRLIYGLNRLGLAVTSKAKDPQAGLFFDIRADAGSERVLTGHNDGLITLNLEEADAAERERIRVSMKERYRTLLGHFRHEIGHYYFGLWAGKRLPNEQFRALFGDESANYQEALRRHYDRTDSTQFSDSFISFYASAHPWEDFAETFAHYLHMVDTLETAAAFGFVTDVGQSLAPQPRHSPQKGEIRFKRLMGEWVNLTVALNSLNRSMGLPDAYPFSISPKVVGKLAFVDALIHDAPMPQESPENAQKISKVAHFAKATVAH